MHRLSIATLSLFVLLFTSGNSYRLPTICSPSHYQIHLVLPEELFTNATSSEYSGHVTITFKCSQNTSQIVLHASASYINVTAVDVVSTSNISINTTSHAINGTTDLLTVTLTSALEADQDYNVTFAFDSKLSTSDNYGFYKSSYTDSSNRTRYLATTQFEPAYARRTFPCFDEPSYKASFSVVLRYPAGLSALENMEAVNTSSHDNGTVTTVFETTPKMSTYLLALVVSDFTCTSGANLIEGSLPQQVCSRNATSATRQLALEVAPLAIATLNSYLGSNYSLNMGKLDQVAVPDFTAGAMENWGLITYRERIVLYDENETSNANRQNIISVINHELTHQWFGNLVTCKWWSEIFLNEGFATFFEFYATHKNYPELEMDKQFVTKALHVAFDEDTATTEALRTNATTQSEISARFGTITYEKGGSVLRMVEHIIGTAAWKAALIDYLDDLKYSSAEPEDLWRIVGRNLTNLPTTNLSFLMENWIDRPGYPVVTVNLTGTQLTLTQKRFVFSNSTDTNTTWYVPITYTTSQDPSSAFEATLPKAWLTPTSSLTLNVTSNISWIVLNNRQTGYYRVNYDSALWKGLAQALLLANYSNIPEINRAQIVNDAFNLARGGYITYRQLFEVVAFLSKETSYHVWYSALNGFDYLLKRIGQNTTLGAAIADEVLNLTSTVAATVPIATINSSEHVYTLKQVLVQQWQCKLGNSNCTTEAVRLFSSYKSSSTRPNKNLRSLVYCYGLRYSTNISADWNFLWNAFLATSTSTEQVTILSALGCPDNEAILKEYLNKTLVDASGIRSQDYRAAFSAVYQGSSVGVNVALDFFIDNYHAIVSRYASLTGIGVLLKGIAEQITTDGQLVKLQRFIASGVLNGTELEAGNSALTTAQNNYAWVNQHKAGLNEFFGLSDNSTSTSTTTTTTTSATTSSTTTTTTTISPISTTTESASHRCRVTLTIGILCLIVRVV